MLSTASAQGAQKDIYTLKGWCAGKGPRSRVREAVMGDVPREPGAEGYTLLGYAHRHGVRSHALALGYC